MNFLIFILTSGFRVAESAGTVNLTSVKEVLPRTNGQGNLSHPSTSTLVGRGAPLSPARGNNY